MKRARKPKQLPMFGVLADVTPYCMGLPPGVIVSAARSDLDKRFRWLQAQPADRRWLDRYAFAPAHVRLADGPRDLIRRAIEGLYEGQTTARGNLDRLRLYSDRDALMQAWELAGNE